MEHGALLFTATYTQEKGTRRGVDGAAGARRCPEGRQGWARWGRAALVVGRTVRPNEESRLPSCRTTGTCFEIFISPFPGGLEMAASMRTFSLCTLAVGYPARRGGAFAASVHSSGLLIFIVFKSFFSTLGMTSMHEENFFADVSPEVGRTQIIAASSSSGLFFPAAAWSLSVVHGSPSWVVLGHHAGNGKLPLALLALGLGQFLQ